MTNACAAKFTGIHKAALPLPTRRKVHVTFTRIFSTWASPFPFSSTTLIHPPFAINAMWSDVPQLSDEWFALRKDRLTTSTFSTALGFWKGNRRYELWFEKVFAPQLKDSKNGAMEWGILNEAAAIERYKTITGRDVGSLGFAIHAEERYDWVGASPDGLLGCIPKGGILEVKCPFNKGKPETGLPWSTVPFYYMPQVQGQMEIMDRDWVDLYCWTPNGSTIFRVNRDPSYWELIHGVLREFWWENVVPARNADLLGDKDKAMSFKPTSTHKLTGLVIAKSIQLAGDAKLLCRETAGRVEFNRSNSSTTKPKEEIALKIEHEEMVLPFTLR